MDQPIRKELAIWSEITEILLKAQLSVPDFLKRVLIKLTDLIPSDLSFIGIIEESEGSQWIVVRDPANQILGAELGEWHSHIGRLKVGAEDLPQKDRSFVGIVAHTRKAHKSEDVSKESYYRASNHEIKSELAVPVIFQEEALAVINLESKTPAFFTEEHQTLLVFLAKAIAPALHSLMITEGLRRPFIKVLDEIEECINSIPAGIPLAATNVLDEVASTLARSLNSAFCQIWVQESENSLAVRGEFVQQEAAVAQDQSLAPMVQRAIMEKSSLKLGLSYEPPEDTSTVSFSVPSLVVPMLVFGNPIGAIVVAYRRSAGLTSNTYYTGADEQLINIVQGQIAAAIEFNRLEITRRENSYQRARQVSEIARIFARLDLSEVLQKIVLRIPDLCKSRYCSIFIWDENRKEFVLSASKGLPEEQIGVAAYAPGEGLTGWVGLHGKPLLLDCRTQSYLARIAPDLKWKSKYNEAREVTQDSTILPFAAVPIFGDGQTIGVLRLSERAEGTFTESDEFLMTLVAGKISTAIAYSEQYERRMRLLRSLLDLIDMSQSMPRSLACIQDFKREFLQKAAAVAVIAFKADAVIIYGASGQNLEFPPVWAGKLYQIEMIQSSPRSTELPSRIFVGRDSYYWNDARSEQILMGDQSSRANAARVARFVEREGIVSSAAIRLTVAEKPIGIMFLNYRSAHRFDPEEKDLIRTFGSHVALFLETLSLSERISESASKEDAWALGHDLHDVIAVLNTGVVTKAGAILDRLANTGYTKSKLRTDLRCVEKYAGDCIDELREMIGELQRPIEGNAPWHELLSSHISGLNSNLRINIDTGEVLDLPASMNRQLYLITRELFSNILVHANAHRVSIHAEPHNGRLSLTIQDDGIGFMPETIRIQKPSSLGLIGVRRRVEVLKGKLDIDSKPDRGTIITVEVPLPPSGDLSKST